VILSHCARGADTVDAVVVGRIATDGASALNQREEIVADEGHAGDASVIA
jgi:hypothetical protein